MIPTLPSSTLFPYTTLFRSSRGESGRLLAHVTCGHHKFALRRFYASRLDLEWVLRTVHRREGDRTTAGLFEPALSQDRKSTRLNSSHQIISYAVFCLKKKRT